MIKTNFSKKNPYKSNRKPYRVISPDFSFYAGALRCLWFSYRYNWPNLRAWVLETIRESALGGRQ